ncbi:hypothetical protein AQ490_09720 [Wenjunlia vitaminophila]|uniref:DUF4245 domain-containing protein n=2 Tax=Wenjunlia vitaminophila TaxID=76728 RepID=A0A0T6LM73_WENVI|nr:hypothetical protein AQ490_09720 [Wenjunlia vitaminophila]
MILSMAVIGVAAAIVYFFVPHSEGDPVRTVDYRVEVLSARRAAPFPVLAPDGLSKDWRATSVSYRHLDPEAEGAVWHLGFINPQDEYAAVEQSNGPAEAFIADKSKSAERSGTTVVRGKTWERYSGPKYNALVRQEKDVTTVVTGTAPHRQLAVLAAALSSSASPAPADPSN